MFSRDRLAKSPAFIRVGIFLVTLLLGWLPFAAVLRVMVQDANLLNILAMSLLFVEFLVLLRFWGRRIYRQSAVFSSYGLGMSRQQQLDLMQGLAIGLISLFILFWVQAGLGWVAWRSPSPHLPRFFLEGALTGFGVGFAEELIFRGWLLQELEQDYTAKTALWINSFAFAILHFLKPLDEVWQLLPQIGGLWLLGLILVWAKWATQGRLGLPIGLHAGLVWGFYLINVGEWVDYTQQVPEWVTGIDRNPLAGIMGLLVLSGLAIAFRGRAQQQKMW
ncbi:CPBP family intramembrane metalloprotease [Oscillatoria sp. FACHB-1407]|nr:CPBP family intramembrane metalloprotease [Oscillatoria sp. FACHB-1407]